MPLFLERREESEVDPNTAAMKTAIEERADGDHRDRLGSAVENLSVSNIQLGPVTEWSGSVWDTACSPSSPG